MENVNYLEAEMELADFFKDYLERSPIPDRIKYLSMYEQDEHGAEKKVYLGYPLLFSEAFGMEPSGELQAVCVAGYLYYLSLIRLDKDFDNGRTFSSFSLEVISTLQEEAIKILTSVFGPRSDFWELWKERKHHFFQSLQQTDRQDLTFAAYEDLADYKSAFGKSAVDALFVLGGRHSEAIHKQLILSHRYFSIGMQLSDDVKDIKEDFKAGQFNWAYQTVVRQFPEYDQQIDLVVRSLYIKGIARDLYTMALSYYDRAKQLALDAGAGPWLKMIDKKRKLLLKDLRSIEEYLEVLAKKAELKVRYVLRPDPVIRLPLAGPVTGRALLNSAVRFLAQEWRKDYGELKHVMYLSGEEGFSATETLHVGDVFQRALLTDIWLDVQQQLEGEGLGQIIEHEINYLLQMEDGGWRYFPKVMEIAPDADDLGQVMQCLYRSGRQAEIERRCVPLLDILLRDNVAENGGIETWIIPRKDRTPMQEKQAYFNQTKWGRGPDVEVVANLLYALTLYDRGRYFDTITNGCHFLLSRQQDNGSWPSRWYYGDLYGTYVCLRLLEALSAHEAATARAYDFLLNSRHPDGGWGLKAGISDPLNTALAILALALRRETHGAAIEEGIKYLKNTQLEDGSWPAIPFIQPRAGQPYKSRTLTTAYVAKALNALL